MPGCGVGRKVANELGVCGLDRLDLLVFWLVDRGPMSQILVADKLCVGYLAPANSFQVHAEISDLVERDFRLEEYLPPVGRAVTAAEQTSRSQQDRQPDSRRAGHRGAINSNNQKRTVWPGLYGTLQTSPV